MSKKDKHIEQKLFSGEEIDDLIAQRLEQKIEQERKLARKTEKAKKVVVKDFEKVPSEAVFSPSVNYLVFNRKAKVESYLNGIQVESLLGLNHEVRESVLNRYVNCFTVGDYYIKFNSYVYTETVV